MSEGGWKPLQHTAGQAFDVYQNDVYCVLIEHIGNGLLHINIKRHDNAPLRDWPHFQQIKNELLGPECEAFEIYPPESSKFDTGNVYHLWGWADPAIRLSELLNGARCAQTPITLGEI